VQVSARLVASIRVESEPTKPRPSGSAGRHGWPLEANPGPTSRPRGPLRRNVDGVAATSRIMAFNIVDGGLQPGHMIGSDMIISAVDELFVDTENGEGRGDLDPH
jgi:hypothetical protein